MLRNKKRNDGFTLIEIIVVLLIIGILLAITIPSIMGYVKKAEDAKYQAQVRPMFLEAQSYAIEMFGKYGLEGKTIEGNTNKTETTKLITNELKEKFQENDIDGYKLHLLSIYYDGLNEESTVDPKRNIYNHDITKIGFWFVNENTKDDFVIVMISNDEVKTFDSITESEIHDINSKWYCQLF